jgi:hypothetical protein
MAMVGSQLLDVPDLSEALPPSDRAAWWTKALTAFPFIHSFFWLMFFVSVAVWRKPEVGLFFSTEDISISSNILRLIYEFNLRVISIWMMYGLLKFLMMIVCAFIGLNKIKNMVNVRNWRMRAIKKMEEQKRYKDQDATSLLCCAKINATKCCNKKRGHDSVHGDDDEDSHSSSEGGACQSPGTSSQCKYSESCESLCFDNITHVVVIPNYSEPASTLARTLDTLQEQSVSAISLSFFVHKQHSYSIPPPIIFILIFVFFLSSVYLKRLLRTWWLFSQWKEET